MNRKYSHPIIRLLARQLLICILPLILIGCGKTESEGDRTLRIGGLGGKPAPINQIISNQTVSTVLHELVFSRLVRINSRMLPEPDLAESWQVSPDGLTYTFNLRKGVRFHDNVELTAEDCVFTYNAVLDPANKSPWRDNYIMIKTVKAEDRHIFTVTLREPQASFINLMNFSVLPKHLLDGKDIRTARFNQYPIGTGPFRFREKTADDRIILEANPDYYEGKPAINRIEATGYDSFPQYYSAFMKGGIDMIQFLNTEQYATLARDPGFRAYNFPSIYTYMIDYNPAHPLFKDKKVRQAMAQAINIPEIINKVESGLGIQSAGPFIPGAWFSNPEVKPFEYNPAEALELLKEAGWKMNVGATLAVAQNNNGQARGLPLQKDGQEFRFTLLVDPKERITETIAKIIYQDLYKIGVRCEIKTYDHSRLDEAPNKELIAEAGAAVISFMILPNLEPSWHSGKQQQIGKLWRYVNPETDKLFEQADATPDLEQRKNLYHQLHRLVYAEQSGTFLYVHPNLCAIRNRFGNTDRFFSAALPFYTIKEWEINR